jgi:hypothetical protein
MVNPDPVDNRKKLLLSLLQRMKAGQAPQNQSVSSPTNPGAAARSKPPGSYPMPEGLQHMPLPQLPMGNTSRELGALGQQMPDWKRFLAMLMGGQQ